MLDRFRSLWRDTAQGAGGRGADRGVLILQGPAERGYFSRGVRSEGRQRLGTLFPHGRVLVGKDAGERLGHGRVFGGEVDPVLVPPQHARL